MAQLSMAQSSLRRTRSRSVPWGWFVLRDGLAVRLEGLIEGRVEAGQLVGESDVKKIEADTEMDDGTDHGRFLDLLWASFGDASRPFEGA